MEKKIMIPYEKDLNQTHERPFLSLEILDEMYYNNLEEEKKEKKESKRVIIIDL